MCGIFGALFVPPTTSVDVEAALVALHHRGPDGRGTYRHGTSVLGHTRLAILDLTEAGAQPMKSIDGQVVVTFNGEIYNHRELRAELKARGHQFHSRSDTEVIVEGFRAWGEALFDKLDGMYAIGIFEPARRRLVLARDRTGQKPLFYRVDGAEIRFASEVKALIASGVRAEVNVDALPLLLSFGYVPPPGTMYRGIAQLPPATVLVMEEGNAPTLRTIWHAPYDAPPLRCTEGEAIAEVRWSKKPWLEPSKPTCHWVPFCPAESTRPSSLV